MLQTKAPRTRSSAHVRSARGAADEGGKDEVEAHVKTKRADDGDDGDDVRGARQVEPQADG